MNALLLLTLLTAAPPWQGAPSVAPQWVGSARPKTITRIVSVAPSVTETLFALGYEAQVVGVTRYDDRPPRVKKLPTVGGFWDPNVEAILALKPDLVIAVANVGAQPALQQLAELSIPVFVVPGDKFADAFHATTAIAGVLGTSATKKAAQVVAQMKAQIIEASKSGAHSPKVLVVFGHNPLVVGGPESLAGTALQLLGARNVVAAGPRPYPHWSPELLLVSMPDIIIDAVGAHGRAQTVAWKGLAGIPAVKNGRVYSLNLAVLLRPSPRLAEGISTLGAALSKE
jgi:iron complex transport system substrate-binding protein